MTTRNITVWLLKSASPTHAGMPDLTITLRDELGLTSQYRKYPAGWSSNPNKFESMVREHNELLDTLVACHPVLGSDKLLDALKIMPSPPDPAS